MDTRDILYPQGEQFMQEISAAEEAYAPTVAALAEHCRDFGTRTAAAANAGNGVIGIHLFRAFSLVPLNLPGQEVDVALEEFFPFATNFANFD